MGCLMVLEAGKLGAWGDRMVLECMELPTLTSFVVLLVLEWLEVNASSPLLRPVVFLLSQQLSGGLLLVWDPSVMLMGSERSLVWWSSSCCLGFGLLIGL